ncbi:MAG TPA: TlpA disulfide reductase family protein [Bryobacteraceae bacterium]|nr:TlpA disulfide reductase family protein [Bryobacteraceae bacterium]
MTSRTHLAAASAALALLLASCSRPSSSPTSDLKSQAERKAAPNFSLKDADGNAVNLADYRGKVVLVNFWATWCGPCEAEIPWFIEFEKKYKDQGFAVLGVSMDDDGWKSVRPYIASHKINYRIMIGSEVVSQQFGEIESLPTSFVLDREGRIAANHVGLVDKVDYQNEIVKLLQDPKSIAIHDAGTGVLAGLTGASVRAGQRP